MILALEVILGVAVLAGIALVISRDVHGVDDADIDVPDIGLPADRLLRSDDIDRLRFRVVSGIRGAVRGYRFADVDATMQLVQKTLQAHEASAAAGKPAQRQPRVHAEPSADDD